MDYLTEQILEKLTKSRDVFYPMYYLTQDEVDHIVRVLNNHKMYEEQDKHYAKWCEKWRSMRWNKQLLKENKD